MSLSMKRHAGLTAETERWHGSRKEPDGLRGHSQTPPAIMTMLPQG
jgi:hypothetical protein